MDLNRIHAHLMALINNEFGVAGLMGNIGAESAFRSDNLQDSGNRALSMTDEAYTAAVDDGTYKAFATDRRGYGLCQWTSSGRKTALLQHSKEWGLSIGSEILQLTHLVCELTTAYRRVLTVLKNATSVKEASDYVVKRFECPKDQSNGALNARCARGIAIYEQFVNKKEIKMITPVNYKQYGKYWKDLKYAVDGEKSTIKSAGCGPTTAAMVLASLCNPFIDPVTCAAYARIHGYKVYNSGTAYAYFTAIGKYYGVEINRMNTLNIYHAPNSAVHVAALAELQRGHWLIACMGKGLWTKNGHYVLAYAYENGKVFINDPASDSTVRSCNNWDTFKNEVKYYWSVNTVGAAQTAFTAVDAAMEIALRLRVNTLDRHLLLSKTPTVSRTINHKNSVVYTIQKYLTYQGFSTNGCDGSFGKNSEVGAKQYQKDVVHLHVPDGEFTAKGKSWKTLLRA